MGAVHAKSADNAGEVGGGLFEFEEPVELEEEPMPKPQIKLEGVRARVDRVHVDGLNRTKDDIIKSTVNDLFQATDFEDVIMRAHKVRRALDSMGCFRDIGVFIDVSSGPEATPEGLEFRLLLAHGVTSTVYQQNHEYPWSGYKLLDRGLLLDLSFNTSAATKHSIQWEGLVRDTSVLSKTTSFRVRESSGPQMKSVVRHIISVDHRDEPIFPTKGSWVQFCSELAGLGGGVAHLKTELNIQANGQIMENVVQARAPAAGTLIGR
ncbi:hypothetical protein evm_003165 [Chilo suppressalis]|nr:hypothetical protein evm_003165 [Chilo suppressalis]